MRRGVWTVLVAAAILGGCLFPSFDTLNGNGAAPDTTGDDAGSSGGKKPSSSSGETSSSSSTGGPTSSSSSTSSSGSSGSTDSGSPDAGSSGTTPKKMPCAPGNTCDVATEHCCVQFDTSAVCKPKGSGCEVWTFNCMGNQDCGTGQSCCQDGANLSASCRNGGCGGDDTMCHTDAPQCSGGSCGDFLGPAGDVQAHSCN